MAAVWGMLAAASIGGSELFGRRVAGVAGPLTAALVMQIFATLSALASVTFVESSFRANDVLLGALAGLGIALGMSTYFGGLNRSTATIVAPLVATLSAVIPFCYAVARGSQVSTLAVLGAVIAFVGLAITAGGGSKVVDIAAGVRWGVLSGVGYGFGLSVLIEASAGSGSWPAVWQRFAASLVIAAVVLSTRRKVLPPQGHRLSSVLAGIFGGGASVMYLLGVNIDPPPAVVATSMFPVFSVLVGFAFFADEVSRRQMIGIGLVLAGVAAVVV